MIGTVVQRIPADRRKPIARGLLGLAALTTFVAVVTIPLGIAGGETVQDCTALVFGCEDRWEDWSLSTQITLITIGTVALIITVLSIYAAILLTLTRSHLKKYQAILTGVETMPIQRIADITHVRPSKVRDEIQSLIDSDEIDDFYIDYGADQVVSRKYIPKTSHKTVVKCAECGGNNEVIVGITKHCSFCGQPLLLGRT